MTTFAVDFWEDGAIRTMEMPANWAVEYGILYFPDLNQDWGEEPHIEEARVEAAYEAAGLRDVATHLIVSIHPSSTAPASD